MTPQDEGNVTKKKKEQHINSKPTHREEQLSVMRRIKRKREIPARKGGYVVV
jgi:hypothetical protein